MDRSYTYDELDRITAIYSGGQLVERYSYSERGRTVTVTDGKGENYVYRKDEFGRLVEEQNRLGDSQSYLRTTLTVPLLLSDIQMAEP